MLTRAVSAWASGEAARRELERQVALGRDLADARGQSDYGHDGCDSPTSPPVTSGADGHIRLAPGL